MATVPSTSLEIYYQDKFSKVNLDDYRGKWVVLLFYTADFTFVCPTELKDTANHYPAFQKEGAEIISISTDTTIVYKAWHDHSPSIAKITYPMGADPTATICRTFGAYIESDGLSLRGTFILGPDGKLIAYDLYDNSIGRNIEEILRKL